MSSIRKLLHENIEAIAIDELKNFDPKILEKPNPSCILKFAQQLCGKNHIKLEFTDLGTIHGNKVLGLFHHKSQAIYVDVSVINDLRMNFVLAHEVGHYILHRDVVANLGQYFEPSDTKYDLEGHKRLITDKDWLEWQANTFAANFLMPKETFVKAFVYAERETGISLNNLGALKLNDEDYTWRDLQTIKERLSELYQVTKTSVEYRLYSLRLIENNSRFKNSNDYYNHIADKIDQRNR